MDVLRGVRTLYISTMYIVDNQTVKNIYKPKSLENDKKLFLMTSLYDICMVDMKTLRMVLMMRR